MAAKAKAGYDNRLSARLNPRPSTALILVVELEVLAG